MKQAKYILLVLALITFHGVTSRAQQNDTKEFTAGGLKIILKKTPKDIITATLFIKGGVANITTEQQGLEQLALNLALNGGTTTIDKYALTTELDRLGTTFRASSAKDFSEVVMTCLKDNWARSWTLFTDAILNPAMDQQEFNIIKDQMIAQAKDQEANPDVYLRKLSTEQIFAGTDYAKSPAGVPETLEKFTWDDTKKYYGTVLGKKRSFLVIVGNIDEKDVSDKISGTLARLPEGSAARKPTYNTIKTASVNIKDRDIATNYIIGAGNGPKYFSPEGPLFEFAMSILYDRYFVELRTKRSLSYAPSAGYVNNLIESPISRVYISTIDPKQSLQVMTDIINDIKKNGFTEKEVANKKKEYLTEYYMRNESSSSLAHTLGFCEASGDWRIFDEINNKIGTVKTGNLNGVFNKYMSNIAWTYLGKKDKVAEADFRQPAPGIEKLPGSKVIKQKRG